MRALSFIVFRLAAVVLASGIILLSFGSPLSVTQAQAPAPQLPHPEFEPGVVLVGLKPGVTVQAASSGALEAQSLPGQGTVTTNAATLNAELKALGVLTAKPVFAQPAATTLSLQSTTQASSSQGDLASIYRLQLPAAADVPAAVAALAGNPDVAYAEPDYIARGVLAPNDPLYASQWGLTQIGAPAAWDVATGAPGVVIALIDSGIDLTHPDLAGQLWVNPGEIAGNGVDDDNNGYADDVNGWNFTNGQTTLLTTTATARWWLAWLGRLPTMRWA